MPHPRAIDTRLALALLTLGLLFACAASAQAAVSPGGVGTRASVALADVACVKRCVAPHKVRPGSKVRVRGMDLEEVSKVVFRGAGGPIGVAPLRRNARAATAIVPAGAVAGRPYLIDQAGHRSAPSPHKLFVLPRRAPLRTPPAAAPPAGTPPATAYPVVGKHELWEGFGGPRNHGGADIGAACGTPLVAALAGTIEFNKYEPRGGNYLVIDARDVDADIIYMHMSAPSPLAVGQSVDAGAPVGNVGDTGNASGCHLHFEYWIGEAWRGGEAVDPVPYLNQWEAAGQ